MITFIRRKMKSRAARNIFLWLVIIALGIGFIVIPRLAKRAAKEGWVVSVNGQYVPYRDYLLRYQSLEKMIRGYRSQFGDFADRLLGYMGLAGDPKKVAFNQLVEQTLLDQEAKKLSLHIDSEQVIESINNPGFMQKEFPFLLSSGAITQHGVNEAALVRALRRWGMSPTDFEDAVISALKRDMVIQVVEGAAYVSEEEIKQRYILDYLARKFAVLTFDFDSFLKEAKKEKISKAALKKFYGTQNALKKRYWVAEKRSGKAYVFDPKSYGVSASEDDIKNYYEDNKMRKYVEKPAEIQARRILFKVAEGQDEAPILEKANQVQVDLLLNPSKFEEVAKKMSDDKETAEKGGLLPFFSRGTRNKEFEKATFMLKADGDISKVVRTDEGFEIVQRVKRKMPEFKSLKAVKAEIKSAIENLKFKRLFTRDMNKIIGKRQFDKKRFDEIIKKAVKKEDVPLQAKTETKRSKTLFGIRGNIPRFYVEDDKGVLVQLSDVKKRHLPVLADIEEMVKNDVYEMKASAKLNKFLEEAKTEAKTKSLDEIKVAYAKQYGAILDKTVWTKKNDKEKVNALRTKGYPADQMLKIEKVGGVAFYRGAQETSEGYLVKVDEIEKVNDKEYGQKKDTIKKELMREKTKVAKEDFIAFLRKKATIKTNKDLIKR